MNNQQKIAHDKASKALAVLPDLEAHIQERVSGQGDTNRHRHFDYIIHLMAIHANNKARANAIQEDSTTLATDEFTEGN